LLSNEATEATRTLAAEVLADFESDETKEALQTVAKQRWGSSAALREAATKALAAVEARRAKKQPQTAAAGKS
jgi:hypothetical protein